MLLFEGNGKFHDESHQGCPSRDVTWQRKISVHSAARVAAEGVGYRRAKGGGAVVVEVPTHSMGSRGLYWLVLIIGGDYKIYDNASGCKP